MVAGKGLKLPTLLRGIIQEVQESTWHGDVGITRGGPGSTAPVVRRTRFATMQVWRRSKLSSRRPGIDSALSDDGLGIGAIRMELPAV